MSYKYYSTERPVMPGSFPKPQGNTVLNIENFNDRSYVGKIGREAWGFIEYEKPISPVLLDDFELVAASDDEDKENWNSYGRAVTNFPNVLYTHTADMVAARILGV